MVMEKFSEIENKNVKVPEWPRHPYADDQYGQKVKIVPIKDSRSLTISFTTDDLTEFYKSSVRYIIDFKNSIFNSLNLLLLKPDNYLTHLIGHEGKGSILSELRRLGWCNE